MTKFVDSSVFWREFVSMFAMRYTAGMVLPSFADFISSVVAICAKEQVCRITTRRVVACMKNVKFIWKESIGASKGEAVRLPMAAVGIEKAISTARGSSIPRPAFSFSAALHSGPKPLFASFEIAASPHQREIRERVSVAAPSLVVPPTHSARFSSSDAIRNSAISHKPVYQLRTAVSL